MSTGLTDSERRELEALDLLSQWVQSPYKRAVQYRIGGVAIHFCDTGDGWEWEFMIGGKRKLRSDKSSPTQKDADGDAKDRLRARRVDLQEKNMPPAKAEMFF